MNNRYFLLRLRLIFLILRKKKITLTKLLNAIHCFIAYQFRLKSSAKAPFMINFELWNECQSNCLFCRTADGMIFDLNPNGSEIGIPKGKMPFEMYKNIIKQVKKYLLMAVLYINGEPLLYTDIYDVIKYSTENQVPTMIATNGILLNKRNASRLLKSGIDFVKIAMSGFTQEVYNIQHRFGNIEEIKKNIRDFVIMNKTSKNKAIIMIDYIYYNHNKHELIPFRNFCKELGIMFNVRPGNIKGMGHLETSHAKVMPPERAPCGWLWKVMTVNWSGDILPCCDCVVWSGIKPYARYKINHSCITYIWNGYHAKKMRMIHSKKNRQAIPICSVCQRKGTAFKF